MRYVGWSVFAVGAVVVSCYIGIRFLEKRNFVGIVKSLYADTFFKAFLLNSIAVAMAVAVTTTVNSALVGRAQQHKDISLGTATAVTVATALCATFVSYASMYVLFGFGRGMFVGPAENLGDAGG